MRLYINNNNSNNNTNMRMFESNRVLDWMLYNQYLSIPGVLRCVSMYVCLYENDHIELIQHCRRIVVL